MTNGNSAELDELMKALADCRDALPVPEVDSPLEEYWMQAIGDPMAVPAYIRAALSVCADGGKGEAVGDVVFQIQAHIAKTWLDVTMEAYESTPFERRILYTAPQAEQLPQEDEGQCAPRAETEEIFDRQQAGFDRCFEALGITDDRERGWSSLVLAINDAVAPRAEADTAGASSAVTCQFKACSAPFVCNRAGKCQMDNMQAQAAAGASERAEARKAAVPR